MTDEGDPAGRTRLDRRQLLAAVGTLAMSASAGCTVRLEDGIAIEFGDGANEGTTTPTTDYGYGGSATATATATSTSVPTAPEEGSDEDSSTSTVETVKPTSTATSTPEDDYGEQGYGQYQYGG
ncbi:hypothetical protein [Halodesulfurarchaeum sp.]|uniref:hypothetical protein n=1 Tax=Halodesulfurarchaeum sp. TaxID=1980530 RepID=UPI002FC2F905